MVLKKSKADNSVLFIDASAEFVRGGNKNKLTDDNIARILNAYIERKDSQYFARLVPSKEILENDSNISVSSYVVQEDKREVVDISKLNSEIEKIVKCQQELRSAIDEIVADLEGDAK